MVDEAIKILTSNKNIKELGKLLDESWKMKKDISSKISTYEIDQIYDRAKKAGAIGGKLLGAGGGGFMLLFVEPDKQAKVLQELSNILYIPFAFENEGSKIIYYDQKYNSFVKNSFHGKSFEDHSDEFKKITNSKKQHIE
jgi:D-glycero-alpha-D-manno-heptose-7-phosphate kinase